MSLDFDVTIDSEQEEDPIEDSDTISNIQEVFRQKFFIDYQECATLKKKYITHATSSNDFSKIAIGIGNEMQVYDMTSTGLSKYIGKNEFGQFTHPVSGVKFFNNDPNLVMASTIAGEIHMYDLRSFKKVFTFEDDTEVVVKPVNCFDVNSNDRLICAGTDEINHEVYLLFFDIQERRLMGGFFESHQEEITDVKFHPTEPDTLASGSTDGLINIFDCKQEGEEDALLHSLNTCDSVNKLKWHQENKLSCITNTNDLHLYDITSQDLLKKWERSEITETMKRKSVMDCHIVDCHNIGSEMMFVATSNYNKGECIRSIKFNEKSLDPLANITGNNQIIRASLYNEKDNVYLTFGEGAIISIWKEGISSDNGNSSKQLKEESSIKKKMKKKANPY
ncbi:WD repeat-containing protein 89 [Chironomus tepperi]|uniref:WD repeat-containing protein 89 n=1 Tax=Chironomus tepperi TaxID=113505 RepID=UPI00391F64BD